MGARTRQAMKIVAVQLRNQCIHWSSNCKSKMLWKLQLVGLSTLMRSNRSRLETDQKCLRKKENKHEDVRMQHVTSYWTENFEQQNLQNLNYWILFRYFFFTYFENGGRTAHLKMKSYCRTTRNNPPPPPISMYIFPISIMVTSQEVEGKITEESSKIANAGKLSNSALIKCRTHFLRNVKDLSYGMIWHLPVISRYYYSFPVYTLHHVFKHVYFISFRSIIYTPKKYPWYCRHIVCKHIVSLITGPYTSCHVLSTCVDLCSTIWQVHPTFLEPFFLLTLFFAILLKCSVNLDRWMQIFRLIWL